MHCCLAPYALENKTRVQVSGKGVTYWPVDGEGQSCNHLSHSSFSNKSILALQAWPLLPGLQRRSPLWLQLTFLSSARNGGKPVEMVSHRAPCSRTSCRNAMEGNYFTIVVAKTRSSDLPQEQQVSQQNHWPRGTRRQDNSIYISSESNHRQSPKAEIVNWVTWSKQYLLDESTFYTNWIQRFRHLPIQQVLV